MTDTDTQTVVDDTKEPAAPATAEPNAQDDLASLLNEFDTETKPTQPEPKPAAEPSEDRYVKLERELARLSFEADFKPVLEELRGDIPKDIMSDQAFSQLIRVWADENPVFHKAWDNRNANPAAWKKAEKLLKNRVEQLRGPRIDQDATETKEAVAAAVRSASTKTPPEKPPNFGSLSNPEYRQTVKDKYGFDPGV